MHMTLGTGVLKLGQEKGEARGRQKFDGGREATKEKAGGQGDRKTPIQSRGRKGNREQGECTPNEPETRKKERKAFEEER